jgi:cyclase
MMERKLCSLLFYGKTQLCMATLSSCPSSDWAQIVCKENHAGNNSYTSKKRARILLSFLCSKETGSAMNLQTWMSRIIVSAMLAMAIPAVYAQTPAPPAAPAPADAPLVTHQLRPNIYWIENGGGNSVAIIGNTSVIVLDTKTTADSGKALLEAIAKITSKPVSTAILTHADNDHANGLAGFPTTVKVIAQANAKNELQWAWDNHTPPNAIGPEHSPTMYITKEHDRMTIDGVKFEFYHWGKAHTTSDLIIYLPDYKIVDIGDMVATYNPYPRIHDEMSKRGSSAGWLVTANNILKIDADVLIPGHGNLQTKEDLKQRIDRAIVRRNETIKLAKEGKSLAEVKNELNDNETLPYKSWVDVVYAETKEGK